MGRAEKRRLDKENNKKTATYNFTKEQLDNIIRKSIEEELGNLRRETDLELENIRKNNEMELEKYKEKLYNDAVTDTMALTLSLPITVLMENFWQKSAEKRLPKFVDLLLDLYKKWQNGEVKIEELKENLWEYGGIKIELKY